MQFFVGNCFLTKQNPEELEDFLGKWKGRITDEDTVHIIGNFGEIDFLKGLPGILYLMLGSTELSYMQKYLQDLNVSLKVSYQRELFETFLKEKYQVKKVTFSNKKLVKLYTGRSVQLINDGNCLIVHDMGTGSNYFLDDGEIVSETFVEKYFKVSD